MFFGNFAFTVIPFIVFVGAVVIFSLFIVAAVKGFKTWSYNNEQPVLTVWAKVVSKRTNVSSHMNNNDNMSSSTHSTTYYVTFQVESGDRMEFNVRGSEYGMLVEGDSGKLTFQGSRYKGFSRELEK